MTELGVYQGLERGRSKVAIQLLVGDGERRLLAASSRMWKPSWPPLSMSSSGLLASERRA